MVSASPALASSRAEISGHVTDAAGRPVAGARVDWTNLGDHDSVTTDATSRYAPVVYDEEAPGAAGPGVVVAYGSKVRLDLTLVRE